MPLFSPQTPNASHVATQLARQAHRTIEAITSADTKREVCRRDVLQDRLAALEAEVTWHPTGSPEAALFQISVAGRLVDSLRDKAAIGGFDRESARISSSLERLFGSLLRYVEKTSGATRKDFGLDYYGNEKAEGFHWGIPATVLTADGLALVDGGPGAA